MMNIEQNKHFLFGCDSNDTVTKLYYKCVDKYPHLKDKFILITADTDFKISDASEQFKEKYVFYSPKITFGVDFSIDDEQDVFIYIKGRTLSPYGIFQQSTRTRNIKTLYYFCECMNNQEQFKTLSDLEEQLKVNVKNNDVLNKLCLSLDVDDELTFLENTFFKLYAYNEYISDVFNTGKLYHFENILITEGFEISSEGEAKKLDKDTREELTELIQQITTDEFNAFLNSDDKLNPKYDNINKSIQLLNLPYNNDILESYKDIIMNKYKIKEHLNLIRLVKTAEYNTDRLAQLQEASLKVNLLKYDEYKISLIKELEQFYNIKTLDVKGLGTTEFKALDASLFLNIKKAFETKKEAPTNSKELQQLYITMLKQVVNKDIVTSKQVHTRTEDRGAMMYKMNDHFIKYHIELNSFSNKNYKNYDKDVLTRYDIKVIDVVETSLLDKDMFID
jgi:hypothetical protein